MFLIENQANVTGAAKFLPAGEWEFMADIASGNIAVAEISEAPTPNGPWTLIANEYNGQQYVFDGPGGRSAWTYSSGGNWVRAVTVDGDPISVRVNPVGSSKDDYEDD